jgi:hypothetical protein
MEDNRRISWKTLDGIDGLSQKTPDRLSQTPRLSPDKTDGLS